MSRQPLDPAAIAAALTELPGWQLADGRLHKVFAFASFVPAFAFMTAVALVAEKLDHHPDWSNSYRTVTVDLSTHSAGGVTALDVALARQMEALAGT
ncbi:MAG: 4a-hydroxytetrahydrobiopterin dehydratase [Ardenticatenia bacterium]|nr:4a-hydroxytetrahydrobiopterin dehydratase [Ardenticatenia bacterium]